MRNNGSIVIEDLSGNNIIRGIDGGAVDLYHNGSARLTTSATGIDVSGGASVTASLGIGTPANSTAALYVVGAPTGAHGALAFLRNGAATSSNTSFGGVHFSSSPGTDYSIGKANVNGATSLSFRNGNSGASLMELSSAGNLGVGTSSPSTYDSRANNLVVGDSGDAGVTIFSGATSNARLQFAPSGATGLDNGLIDYDNNNDSMSFATGGTERLRIHNNGNISAGSTPVGKLTLNVNTIYADGLYVRNANGGGNFDLVTLGPSYTSHGVSPNDTWLYSGNDINIGGATGGSNNVQIVGDGAIRMTVAANGRVGIAAAPQSGIKLKVAGSGQEHTIYCTGDNAGYAALLVDNSASSGTRYFASFRISNSTKGNITSTGSVMVYGGTSDYRLKENVVNLTGATDRLKQLRPKRFNFIGDTEIVDGFLAHEVDAVVPVAVVGEKDAVDENGEVDAQQMDNGHLVPLLVATIQELEERLTALENN